MSLAIEPLGAAADHAFMVHRASADYELVYNTYLPPGMTLEEAADWVHAHTGVAFVLRCDGVAAGLLDVAAGVNGLSMPVPPGTYETETWLLEPYRGRGLAVRAWAMVEEHLRATRPGITHLAGFVWRENTASHRRLAKSGYTDRGEYWWHSEDEEGGWCRLWTRCLHAPGGPCWPDTRAKSVRT